ncbi:MAG: BatA domain-containing protein [Gemmatimonadetes bacterium]|nr:BatA domain-containing protein [Gemmatimonadota bacterium]
MTWLQPWAWLGAATILLPTLIHLLGRGQSRTHRFPSLRFIDAARLLPAQRTRLQDLPLLVVRVAVLLLASSPSRSRACAAQRGWGPQEGVSRGRL